MPGQTVEILLAGHYICPGAVLSGVTNPAGRVRLSLFGGGCTESMPLAAVIKVGGMVVRSYDNIKSPDYNGAAGDGAVDLSDLVAFTSAFLGAPGDCHDYDNDEVTGLSDLVLFGPSFMAGNSCP